MYSPFFLLWISVTCLILFEQIDIIYSFFFLSRIQICIFIQYNAVAGFSSHVFAYSQISLRKLKFTEHKMVDRNNCKHWICILKTYYSWFKFSLNQKPTISIANNIYNFLFELLSANHIHH